MGPVLSYCQKKPTEQEENEESLLLRQISELMTKNSELEEQVNKLTSIINDQRDMIEQQLGKDVERITRGKFNNAGETSQPMSLSIKCRNIFDKEWRDVMKGLFRGDNELTGIRFLSKILEDCQRFCQNKAREQLEMFVNPFSDAGGHKISEVIKSSEDLHNLHKLRRTIGLYGPNEDAVTNMFFAECKKMNTYMNVIMKFRGDDKDKDDDDDDTDKKSDNKETKSDENVNDDNRGMEGDKNNVSGDFGRNKDDNMHIKCLDVYIKSCCSLCWQCAISDPPIFLNFDVLGKHLNEIDNAFQTYTCSYQPDEEGVQETVMQVVWPALIMRDGDKDILISNAKGSVIVYTSSSV